MIGLNGSNRMGMKWVYFGSKSENFTGFWRVWVPGFKRFPDSFFAFRPNLAKMAAYLWTMD